MTARSEVCHPNCCAKFLALASVSWANSFVFVRNSHYVLINFCADFDTLTLAALTNAVKLHTSSMIPTYLSIVVFFVFFSRSVLPKHL